MVWQVVSRQWGPALPDDTRLCLLGAVAQQGSGSQQAVAWVQAGLGSQPSVAAGGSVARVDV